VPTTKHKYSQSVAYLMRSGTDNQCSSWSTEAHSENFNDMYFRKNINYRQLCFLWVD